MNIRYFSALNRKNYVNQNNLVIWLKPSLLFLMLTSYASLGFSSSLTDNMRLSLDTSVRGISYDLADTTGHIKFAGIDLHKVFSSDSGDICTLTAQAYWPDNTDIIKRPGFFDDEDDNRVVYRIFNFNYSGFGLGKPRIKIGHFEIPYGIEHAIVTNGTLRNYTSGPNLGVKADWGLSVNGEASSFEYEVAVTRGGIQSWDRDDGDFVHAGRVSTPSNRNLIFGLSAYRSELKTTERRRYGVDMQWYLGLWGIFAEASTGDTNDRDILNGSLEINFRPPIENYLAYIQVNSFSIENDSSDSDGAVNTNIGIRYTPDNHWALSTQFSRDISTMGSAKEDRTWNLQLRYRF